MTPVPFTSVTMSEQMLTMTPGMLGKTGFSLEHELEVRHQSATYAAAPSLSASVSFAFHTTMSRSRSESEPGIIPVVTPVISHGHWLSDSESLLPGPGAWIALASSISGWLGRSGQVYYSAEV